MSDEHQSDAPPDSTDLVKEREAFVRTFLKKGVEFTEELVQENAQLRQELAELRSDNARLRAQVASDDAIRDLLRTVEGLEKEKRDLLQRSQHLEQSQQRDERRFAEIEAELNDMANLYVASQQLHGGLSVRRVIGQLRDIVGQLVGAEEFVIYAMSPDASTLEPIGSEGVDDARLVPLPVEGGPVGDACLTGMPKVVDDPTAKCSPEAPLAAIPMQADGVTVGVISILSLLAQKRAWASVDQELFKLLGRQAGVALIAANLYASSSGPLEALKGLGGRT